ncbi:4-hydroxybenzoate polyprenyltransferase [Mucilaginibacter gracilis]|uniref:4-hydroxybenzoate polyprenyltransferase n=1 Tax=Mucilaginibacter gracilis TaxID=423350 RepID=A0A495J0V8_9SPHI|nr:UbiA family prenyltransferase [Mucilaginibacter gracilis]RKR82251.1 4-hydroxybenzoate polyprenyltransferase [Mucilaginibacter gracilis]
MSLELEENFSELIDNISIDVPIVVDLDGTLIASDCYAEALIGLIFSKPVKAIKAIFFILFKSIAASKIFVSINSNFKAELLPYRENVLSLLKRENEKGRKIILATAAPEAMAWDVANHLGLFTEVIATTSEINLKGRNKKNAIEGILGGLNYIYIGDSTADIPILESAMYPAFVGSKKKNDRIAKLLGKSVIPFLIKPIKIKDFLKQLRVFQWTKNFLVLLPALTGFGLYETKRIISVFIAMLLMCVSASFIYILNDLADIWDDRAHASKKNRPIASGNLSMFNIIFMLGLLMIAILLLGNALDVGSRLIVLGYLGLNLLYTQFFKKLAVYDIVLLTFLYILRVLLGSHVLNMPNSIWFLAFLYLNFLNIAAWKRYVEYKGALKSISKSFSRREYNAEHTPLLLATGIASVFSACVVLVIYTSSSDISSIYHRPMILLLLCPLVLATTLRMWYSTELKKVSHDPVIEILFSKETWIIFVLCLGVIFSARV